MRETQAERLARINKHNGPRNDEENALFGFMVNGGSPEAAQRVLDILASWRTCRNCSGRGALGKSIGHDGSNQEYAFCENIESVCHGMSLNVDEEVCKRWGEIAKTEDAEL